MTKTGKKILTALMIAMISPVGCTDGCANGRGVCLPAAEYGTGKLCPVD